MKKYFFLLLLFPFFLSAQRGFPPEFSSINSEFHLIPNSGSFKGYFIYRVPYNRIVFQKKSDLFEAGLKINLEISELLSKKTLREFNKHVVSVNDFDLTNSLEDYVEGFIEFEIDKGNYNILTNFSDLNSKREFKSAPFNLNTDSISGVFGNPIIVNDNNPCNDTDGYIVTNFSGSIPFSKEKYSVLIPVFDSGISDLKVKIKNNRESVLDTVITESFLSTIQFSECENRIILKNYENISDIRFFIIKDISTRLREGLFSITVSVNGSTKTFPLPVKWINKPFSLRDPESSIQYLSYIETSEGIENLERASKENFQQELFDFWKRYDPTPETAYNELMDEFYKRVDFAEQNFGSLTDNHGAKSDRGKTYIIYGNPTSTERYSDEYGRMIETWKYTNPERAFFFIDKKGNGSFTLMNNL